MVHEMDFLKNSRAQWILAMFTDMLYAAELGYRLFASNPSSM